MALANTVSQYVRQRLGRRGTLLTLLGTAYGLYGVGQFISGPATRFGDLGPGLTSIINSHSIGWFWILGGAVGVVNGIRPRRENDGAGFIAVFIVLMAWAVFYDISWITGLVTDDTYGNSRSWVTSIVWTVQAAVVLVIAGWPDPDPEARPDGVIRE